MDALNPIFKTVIVHEDPITAIQAAEVLKRLAERLEAEHGIDSTFWPAGSNIWKFECLEDPKRWEDVVARTVEADMIIISAGDNTELPVCVRNWIENALPRKQGEPVALVALFDCRQKAGDVSSHSGDYLRQVAEQYGVDFFCNLDGRRNASNSALNEAVTSSRYDAALMDEAIPCDPNLRGWGIND